MGDRVRFQVQHRGEFSPIVYVHWESSHAGALHHDLYDSRGP